MAAFDPCCAHWLACSNIGHWRGRLWRFGSASLRVWSVLVLRTGGRATRTGTFVRCRLGRIGGLRRIWAGLLWGGWFGTGLRAPLPCGLWPLALRIRPAVLCLRTLRLCRAQAEPLDRAAIRLGLIGFVAHPHSPGDEIAIALSVIHTKTLEN